MPETYDKVGKFLLVTAYLWIMYKIREDKGQLIGLYQPWLHEHEHEHLHYIETADGMPELVGDDEDDDEDDENDE